ncbi:hypothetical protein SAMN05421853_1233 [Roseivivax halotolerans]|uniref:Uncharacterized protein n=1 Tax=Roseivivax halotolerans TaxID=93684 RepID=A0A1I6AK83_9RHOB|nr:hypothetical protein [Roseivivax halotolerans]SFQ69093.1 hypothetical protein SAMN05421853_1233 [Roseivivax halotolerans]
MTQRTISAEAAERDDPLTDPKSQLTDREQIAILKTKEDVGFLKAALEQPTDQEGNQEPDPTIDLLEQIVKELATVKKQQTAIYKALTDLSSGPKVSRRSK